MIKSGKIKQFSAAILIVLSLFVSSISACCCDHHQENRETEIASCHSQTDEAKTEKHKTAADEKDDYGKKISVSCECFLASAVKIVGKSENLKIEKHPAVFTPKIETIRGFTAVRAPAPVSFDFENFRVNDSAYNIKSPRAPPRL